MDQYRKKNQLYNHNVVLIPLGDDFRYTSEAEANAQYENYEKIMKYMNSRPDWNVNIQFGTLKDYFTLVRDKKPQNEMPVLSGDFFTYADRADHYWSGYFTSRPLYKRLDRTVEYYLRSAEILFSFANLHSLKNKQESFDNVLYKKLLTARRNLGLFQHHDGITGTAKTVVNNDYGAKLLESIQTSQLIIQKSIELMLSLKSGVNKDEFLVVDDSRLAHDALTTRNVLKLSDGKPRRVYIFNSNEHKRVDIITIHVDTPFLELYDEKDVLITDSYQVNLLWSKEQTDQLYLEHESDVFELLVQIELNAFEVGSIKIKSKSDGKAYMVKNKFLTSQSANPAQVNLVNKKFEEKGLDKSLIEIVKMSDYESNVIKIGASINFNAVFDAKTGLLKNLVDIKTSEEYKLNIRIVHYGVTNVREKSGGKYTLKKC